MERRRRTTAVVAIEKEPYASPFVLALAVIRGPDIDCIHRISVNDTLVGSTNGTLLNGQVVTPKTSVRLKNLDEIEMGRTRILFIAARFHTEPTNP